MLLISPNEMYVTGQTKKKKGNKVFKQRQTICNFYESQSKFWNSSCHHSIYIQATSHVSKLSIGNENISTKQLAELASILGSSDAYVFMLVLSFVALIFACFMPKKTVIQESVPEKAVIKKS